MLDGELMVCMYSIVFSFLLQLTLTLLITVVLRIASREPKSEAIKSSFFLAFSLNLTQISMYMHQS